MSAAPFGHLWPAEALQKLQPDRTMNLRGFGAFGSCAATMHSASPTGFTVSGHFSVDTDWVDVMLHDEDDKFGHLESTRYLPSQSLAGVTLSFTMSSAGAQLKELGWVKADGTTGATASGLFATGPGSYAVDFSAFGLAAVRRAWLRLVPACA